MQALIEDLYTSVTDLMTAISYEERKRNPALLEMFLDIKARVASRYVTFSSMMTAAETFLAKISDEELNSNTVASDEATKLEEQITQAKVTRRRLDEITNPKIQRGT